jgi:hypothetical protein
MPVAKPPNESISPTQGVGDANNTPAHIRLTPCEGGSTGERARRRRAPIRVADRRSL